MVAGYAAKELVERGLQRGELTIVSADTALPYERPPLSKGFLAGKDSEESITINPEAFYREHGIEVRLGSRVAAIDRGRKRLQMAAGDDVAFERLVVATGARVRTLKIPGGDLRGVLYLRSLEDSKAIRTRAESARSALVIGGGFIGMEVASVLAQKQIATTLLVREDRIWKRFFTPGMSRFFEGYYEGRGVRLVKQAEVKEVRGRGGVESVALGDGRTMGCEMVVAGLGAEPVTELAAGAGIAVDDGVVVNEYLEASVGGVYAAGDVANYQDTLFGKRRRVEHWDNAVSQGQHCARVLTGERAPFVHVPYFFSDVFDLSYEFWGDPSDAGEVIARGDVSSPNFSVWWLREKRLMAAFVMNRPDEERELAPRWIASGEAVPAERLRSSGSLTAG